MTNILRKGRNKSIIEQIHLKKLLIIDFVKNNSKCTLAALMLVPYIHLQCSTIVLIVLYMELQMEKIPTYFVRFTFNF